MVLSVGFGNLLEELAWQSLPVSFPAPTSHYLVIFAHALMHSRLLFTARVSPSLSHFLSASPRHVLSSLSRPLSLVGLARVPSALSLSHIHSFSSVQHMPSPPFLTDDSAHVPPPFCLTLSPVHYVYVCVSSLTPIISHPRYSTRPRRCICRLIPHI